MKLKITCFIVLFLMVSVNLLNTDNVSFTQSLEDEETPKEVILSLNSTNIPGFQEGSIFTDSTLSSGNHHTCAILDDGSVSCWGWNDNGQLGDGTTTDRNTSTQTLSLGTGRTAVAISSGYRHTCAILDDGSVSCWGRNDAGQLGDGTDTERNTPTQTLSLGIGRTAVAISSGNSHSCAILDDASVSCWGDNGYGQLGDGTNTTRNTPTQTATLGTGRTAVALSSGSAHTCAILDDGSVSCWGENQYGQLGDGTTTGRNTPTQTSSLGTGRTAVALSSGGWHTCAILNDGYVSCWGSNGNGRLGDGTDTERNIPTQTSSLGTGRTAVAISSGGSHTCAILDDGSVSCWGDNWKGQLGDGTDTYRNAPTQTSSLGTGRTAVAISSGRWHTCAILDDASISCWGYNRYGQLGDGTGGDYSSDYNRNTPTQTSSLGTATNPRTVALSERDFDGDGVLNIFDVHQDLDYRETAISSGYYHTCALLDDGTVSCWGLNNYGQLGDGTTTDRNTPTQTLSLGTGRTAVAISTGQYHTCAILDDGSVSCWGNNVEGQLGDGTATNRNTPTQTSSLGIGRTAVAISSGTYHICAILDDASVSCWGLNDAGQLGDGTTTKKSTPTQTSSLGTGRTAVAISSEYYQTCAILDDGSVSCWGLNDAGQLGDGTTTDRSTPTQTSSLGTGRTAVAISSGYKHTCAILDDATVSCWGRNNDGQIGDGTGGDSTNDHNRNTPTQTSSLGTGRTAVAISTGWLHTCAILDDATVSCWGNNYNGQLGDGTNTKRNTPTQTSSIGTGRTTVALSSGGWHTCAILDDGTVSCWGSNDGGQLGDGTISYLSIPTQTSSLGTGRTTVAISSGYFHTCTILDDGSVSCWGRNSDGQLGDGTTTERNTPTQTSSLGIGRTAVAISSGARHTCAILDDGSVSCWGINDRGQLGDGTTTDRSTPTQTSSLGTNLTAVAISTGQYHTCAILDDGSVSCWGWSGGGRLGNRTGGSNIKSTPTPTLSLGANRTAVAISSGTDHTCAILDDGSVSCWGIISYVQHGNGVNVLNVKSTPTPTSSLGTNRTAVAISTGERHTCALLDDASVSCWGDNSVGQLGDGTNTDQSTPTQTSSLGIGRTAVALSSGGFHTCAILDDATVSCWGDNWKGQLGDGTTTTRNTPTQTSSLGINRTAIAISSGDAHTCAILDDSSVSCWGGNSHGELGDGTINRNTPTHTSSLGTTTNPRTALLVDGDMDGDGTLDYLDDFPNNSIRSIACTSGQYGRYLCVDSPAGKYVPSGSAMYATDCGAGTYQALTGQTSCVNADVGYYVATTSQTSQTACSAGTYQPDVGQSSCISASIGFYVLLDGAIEQTACPNQTSTKEIGSKLESDCVTDSDDDGTIDVDDAFPLDPSEDKDSDGDGRGDNMQAIAEEKQIRMVLIAIVLLLVTFSFIGALVMITRKEDTEGDWHQEDSLFD